VFYLVFVGKGTELNRKSFVYFGFFSIFAAQNNRITYA